jgi:hypothetical protein
MRDGSAMAQPRFWARVSMAGFRAVSVAVVMTGRPPRWAAMRRARSLAPPRWPDSRLTTCSPFWSQTTTAGSVVLDCSRGAMAAHHDACGGHEDMGVVEGKLSRTCSVMRAKPCTRPRPDARWRRCRPGPWPRCVWPARGPGQSWRRRPCAARFAAAWPGGIRVRRRHRRASMEPAARFRKAGSGKRSDAYDVAALHAFFEPSQGGADDFLLGMPDLAGDDDDRAFRQSGQAQFGGQLRRLVRREVHGNGRAVPGQGAQAFGLGTGVRPCRRVMIRLWVASGTVKDTPALAAAAKAAVTPGMMLQLTPSRSRRAVCSRTEPNRDGSPVCTRATSPPARAVSSIRAWVSSRLMPAESATTAPAWRKPPPRQAPGNRRKAPDPPGIQGPGHAP